MKNKFKNGDRVRYSKQAPEVCGMTIRIGCEGVYYNGYITTDSEKIPLIGTENITNCFELVKSPKSKPIKDIFSREEVINILEDYRKYIDKFPSVRTSEQRLNKYIEENL